MTAALAVQPRSCCHLECKLGGRRVKAGKFDDKVVVRMELQVMENRASLGACTYVDIR